jgi:tripartite-type tricarboxylate transporter receptor subunit TctC
MTAPHPRLSPESALSRRRPFLRSIAVATIAAAATVLAPAEAHAQAWPAKPVRLIIPFPPGGSNDVIGRMFATQLGDRLGQQVVVDNRGGAGGIIGADLAAKSAPDGYTLLLISVAYAFGTSMYKNIPYDPVKSFAPVAMLGTGPVVLTVHPSVPAKTTEELIALAKARPGHYQFASAGVGSFQHLASELFRIQAGIDILHVPYKGGGPAMADVIGGHAHILMGSLIQILPHIKSGKLKVLATSGTRRNPALPDVPTVAEKALPGYDAQNWWGILAPAGTPQPVIDRLAKEVAAVTGSPEMKKRLEAEGAEAVQMSPGDFGRFIQAETTKWARVVKQAGITGD